MATFKVFHGKEKPLKAVGKNQSRLLEFAAKYPCWHSYATDKATLAAINGLEKRGSIVVDRNTKQFAIAYDQFKRLDRSPAFVYYFRN